MPGVKEIPWWFWTVSRENTFCSIYDKKHPLPVAFSNSGHVFKKLFGCERYEGEAVGDETEESITRIFGKVPSNMGQA